MLEPAFSRCAVVARLAALLVSCVIAPVIATAQPPGARPDPRSPRERAFIDLTGQWVAVITEDWRWRMLTPPVGDVSSIPLNAEGRARAEGWDLERDRAAGDLCKGYGPPGLIRLPTRLRVSWEDDDTLLLEFDAGRQQRRLHFDPETPPAEHTLQGHSQANWFRQPQTRGVLGGRTATSGGTLQVRTTSLAAGYLRPNGVPYSDRATVKEYFNTFTLPDDGGAWLVVTTVVEDPVYLATPLIISTQFKKESARAKWDPRACEVPAPLVVREPTPPGPFD
jgi:hypothetical protein